MIETALLIKIGLIIKGIVWSGYGIAGSYFVRTGYTYVRDYKESIENEKASN